MGEVRENLLNGVSPTNTGGNPYEIDLDPYADAAGEAISGAVDSGTELLGSAWDSVSETATNVGNGIIDTVSESSFGQFLRSVGLPIGGEPETDGSEDSATWGASDSQKADWRVRLSIAPGFSDAAIMKPFSLTDNHLVFPYTPSIILSNSASYTPIKPVHSNYPFYAYQNSQVDNITITGDFTVETMDDGKYWIAMVHYLRSVTKMAYGVTPNVGAPPPVIKLNGYGEYVFHDVPVVVSNFTVELATDIDYIFVKRVGKVGTHVPTKSTLSVTLIPMYSRRNIKRFSLKSFISGSLTRSTYGFI